MVWRLHNRFGLIHRRTAQETVNFVASCPTMPSPSNVVHINNSANLIIAFNAVQNNANVVVPPTVSAVSKKEPQENIARIAKRYLDDNMQQAWINPRLISMVKGCARYTVRDLFRTSAIALGFSRHYCSPEENAFTISHNPSADLEYGCGKLATNFYDALKRLTTDSNIERLLDFLTNSISTCSFYD
ncbi:hypothetical protein ALC56_12578 [Trachymyrmex septentrionalis]|uniref:Uncharacterized protein n=1 Tax=Trachymyrmex septentrionalis TaxID=34720 RepID=A0A195EYW8_9HYME|nr:hypothetical protein ALC56_12578 [Trachymyrmex septentrionalis]